MNIRLFHVLLLSVPLSACQCDDETRDQSFFGPESFGIYELSLDPDIDGPLGASFGVIPAGEQGAKTLTISNVGRSDLEINAITVAPPFYVQNDQPAVPFRSSYQFEVLAESDGSEARSLLQIRSNDPDEDPFVIPIVMNLEQACVLENSTSFTAWQQLEPDGIVCWDYDIGAHGDPRAYDFTEIPTSDDVRWIGVDSPGIDRRSELCDAGCACRHGGDFTFFQTFVFVGETRSSYRLTMRHLDDGARVTVFNTRYPEGTHAAFVYLGQDSSQDLAGSLESGLNRVVLTHVDDCCSESRINDVSLQVDGNPIERCAELSP